MLTVHVFDEQPKHCPFNVVWFMYKKNIKRIYRFCKATFWSLKLAIRHLPYLNTFAPAHHIFYISPNQVQGLTNCEDKQDEEIRNRNFEMELYRGRVIGGNWDKTCDVFESLAVYQAIKQRMLDHLCWTKTDFFQECMSDINNGRVLWKCKTQNELLTRFSVIDKIIANMTNEGYKRGFESAVTGEDTSTLAKNKRFSDEITVNIGRNGDFIFQDGRHRLAIAKVLNLPLIPVKVLVRHQSWVEQLKAGRDNDFLTLYKTHPDVIHLKENK